MLNGSWHASQIMLIIFSAVAIVCGMGAHFWILARLEEAGFRVKYFATITDHWRAYASYRRTAATREWPVWPFYLAIAGIYGGLVGVFSTLLADRSLLKWLAGRLGR